MTTARFNKLRPFVTRALTHVKTTYCAPPNFAPVVPVRDGRMTCPKCEGTLRFTVAAASGKSTGRCTCGVAWAEI